MAHPVNLAALLRVRAEALARFATWEASHVMRLTPAAAVAAVGALYQYLPPEARRRAIDPAGVARMHQALRHLSQ